MEEVYGNAGMWKYGNVSMEGIYNRNVRIYGTIKKC